MKVLSAKDARLAGILLTIVLIVGCSGANSYSSGGSTTVQVVSCSTVTPAATVTASDGLLFSPSSATISANDVVQWNNTGTVGHTVTSGTSNAPTGLFNEALNPGASLCLRFTTAGTYSYYCSIHPSMTGSVTVQ